MWRNIAAAAALTILFVSCADGEDEAEVLADARGEEPSAPPTAIPMPDGCTPAAPADVQAIEAALAGPTLIDAFTRTVNGYRYVMANVDAVDGSRLTSADIWVFTAAGDLHAASSGAVEYTSLPDVATLPGADPFGAEVSDMISCLVASAQQRNLGG